MQPGLYPLSPSDLHNRVIEIQAGDRPASDTCQAENSDAVITPAKVIGPAVATRMIKTNFDLGIRVNPSLKMRFVTVATDAGKAEIARSGFTAR